MLPVFTRCVTFAREAANETMLRALHYFSIESGTKDSEDVR